MIPVPTSSCSTKLCTCIAVACLNLGCSSSDEAQPPPDNGDVHCAEAVSLTCAEASPDEACVARERTKCATDYYYRSFSSIARDDCSASAGAIRLQQQASTLVWRGTGITDTEVRVQTHALQRYFAPIDLWFIAQDIPASIEMTHAIAGSTDELEQALVAGGIPADRKLTNSEEAQAQHIVNQILFAPLRTLLQSKSQPVAHGFNLVVIAEILDPRLASLLDFKGELAGLGLSPTLLHLISSDDPTKNLYTSIGIEGEFTPTLILGHRTITKYLAVPDAVIAHEMGHAMGLQHVDDLNNLMYPKASPSTCRPVLVSEQTKGLVGTDPMAMRVNDLESWQQITRLSKTLVSRLRPKTTP